jgi:hypothetical protein
MTFSISSYLHEHGPSRSATIVAALKKEGVSAAAARQRVSRAKPPVYSFPLGLLPKGEFFLYLQDQRNTEKFWDNFMRDLRASGSVYGAAIDGMSARGGLVTKDAFKVISGAPILPIEGQLSVDIVAQTLIKASFIKEIETADHGMCYQIQPSLHSHGFGNMRARMLAEGVLLDAVREWARHIGMAGFNSIRIRGEADLKAIGPFAFDLAGPSYLLPLKGQGSQPGFLVADAFAEGMLEESDIQYFIRKARMLKSFLPKIGVMSMLVAESFTGAALKAGHAAGIMMATPKDLFGRRVGAALVTLMETLNNAAAYASTSPERLTQLLDTLTEIEGRAGNLRGILFELMAGYLARRDAVSIEMGVTARDPVTGKTADIDILKIKALGSEAATIEAKGKMPGGSLSKAEVEEWIAKLPTIRGHLRAHPTLREAKQVFEIWTTGTIDPDALVLLQSTKSKWTKSEINWKDGQGVLEVAKAGKEKAITDALYQHFLSHPLSEVNKTVATPPTTALPDFLNSTSTGTAIIPYGVGKLVS